MGPIACEREGVGTLGKERHRTSTSDRGALCGRPRPAVALGGEHDRLRRTTMTATYSSDQQKEPHRITQQWGSGKRILRLAGTAFVLLLCTAPCSASTVDMTVNISEYTTLLSIQAELRGIAPEDFGEVRGPPLSLHHRPAWRKLREPTPRSRSRALSCRRHLQTCSW